MSLKNNYSKFLLLIFLILSYSQIFPQGNQKVFEIPNSNFSVTIGNDSYKINKNGKIFNFSLNHKIKLKYKTFDPLLINPEVFVEEGLKSQKKSLGKTDGSNSAANQSAYIVQFETQAFQEYQEELAQLGGEIYTPIPDHAIVVVIDDTKLNEMRELPYVRWIGKFHPAYKLEEQLQQVVLQRNPSSETYSILLHKKELQNKVIEYIKNIGGLVEEKSGSSRMLATLNGSQLAEVINLNEVLYIDKATEISDDNDQVREIEGANFVETVAGYTGQGVAGEVCDDGVRSTHQEFQANPLMLHSSSNNPTDFDHGTNVTSIVFSSGVQNQARGILPNAARPIFASRFQLGWSNGSPSSTQRYTHIQELVNPSGNYKAVFQTNSWGHSQTQSYTTVSAEFDELLFDLDIIVTQSQSNEGNRDSRPEAWAKNIVSIGGVQGENTLTRSDDNWGYSASIGPAEDGRLKPDLSNFYGNIYSANEGSDVDYSDFGGTSGATPATAGMFGVLHQMWADGVFDGGPGKNRDVFDSRPHMTTAKALMINLAYQYSFNGIHDDLTRVHQGWGFPDVKNIYETARAYGWKLPIIIDETEIIKSLETHSYNLMSDGKQPIKATMVYADPKGNPGATKQLINNLSLKLTSPSSVIYWGNNGLNGSNWSTSGGTSDNLNNVENIFIKTPEVGQWTIEVVAEEIIQDGHVETGTIDADYALIVSGGYKNTPIVQYQLQTSSPNGSINIEPKSPTNYYYNGVTVKLSAEPNYGWRFLNWEGDTNSTDNPISILMDSDKSITAKYTDLGPVIGVTEKLGKTTTTKNRRANPFIMTEDGTIQSISMYHDGGTGNMILGVYDGSGSTPVNRIGVTPVTSVGNTEGWQTIDLTTPVHVLKNQKIFLAWVYENNPGIYYNSGTPGRVDAGVSWTGSMPLQWGNTATQSDYVYSIYASYTSDNPTDVSENSIINPETFKLFDAYPNPFNPTTNIRYSLPKSEFVALKIYNSIGEEVTTLVSGMKNAGVHNIVWNAASYSSGIYYYRITAGNFTQTKKLMLLK